MGHTRARTTALGLLLLAGLLVLPTGAMADDQPEIEIGMFETGGLILGLPWHIPSAPPPVSAYDINNADLPLFGARGEENVYPVGQVDELIEVIKGFTQPEIWESVPGADIRSCSERLILVRAPHKTVEAVGRYLGHLEERVLRSVRIEVRAVPTPADRDGRPPSVAAGMAHHVPTQGLSLSMLAIDRQRVAAHDGRQVAYVAGYRTDIADGSSIAVPVVEVANLGLIADAQATLGEDASTVVLQARVHLTEMPDLGTRGAGEGRRLDAPRFEKVTAGGTFELPARTWQRIGSGHGWEILARVTPVLHKGTPHMPSPLSVRAGSGEGHVARMIDVGEFCVQGTGRLSGNSYVCPNRYAPPEPPELPEPCAVFPPEQLVELIMEATPGRMWEDPASIEARNGILVIRNTPAVLDDVQHLVDALRRELVVSYDLATEVLDLPREVADQLQGTQGSLAASTEALAMLAAARKAGDAHTIESAHVRLQPGVVGAMREGAERRYLGGYTGMIAANAHSANPVPLEFFEGVLVTAVAEPLSTGDAAHVQLLECQRTEHPQPMRTFPTPVGPIDLPSMGSHRMRGGFIAPFGKPIVVSCAGHGDRARVILMTLGRGEGR